MAWFGRLRILAAGLVAEGLDALLPPRCAVCGSEVAERGVGGAVVCPACATTVGRDGARCLTCGAPGAGAACAACRGRRQGWDGIVVLGAYADDLRAAVLRAKRPTGERVAAALAALLVHRRRDVLDGWSPDVVVPVPMHWLRRAVRGTSAADEIARGVAAGLDLPCRRLLRRTRATPMQNTLPAGERRGNVHGAFRVRGRLAGLRVLLVDDVTTTGATLAACGEAAVSAGAAAVYAAAIARADRGESPDA